MEVITIFTLVMKSVETANIIKQVHAETIDLCDLKRGYSSRNEEIIASICTNCEFFLKRMDFIIIC